MALRTRIIVFCLLLVWAVPAGHAEPPPASHGTGTAAPAAEIAGASFLLPLLEKPGGAAFADGCPQFNARINGDSIWSPYYWHVRAVGAHLVRDHLKKRYDPAFEELRKLLGADPDADPVGLLARAEDLADPEGAAARKQVFERREPRRDRLGGIGGTDDGLFEFPHRANDAPAEIGRRGGHGVPKAPETSDEDRAKIRTLLDRLPRLARIAVIDGGMDVDNPWLKERIADPTNPADRDSSEAHAVHVAGVIGGRWPLGIGQYVQIYPFKVVGTGSREPSEAYRSASNAARLTNGSWGFGMYGGPGEAAFRETAESTTRRGTTHFMAAGNSGEVQISELYARSLMKIGAFTATNDRAEFSCVGDRLSFSGYGAGIWSAHATGSKEDDEAVLKRYPIARAGATGLPFAMRRLSGTSMASPVATGVAANLVSILPDLNNAEITELLKRTAIGSPNPDVCLEGAGQVNAYAGMRLAERYRDALGKPTIKLGADPSVDDIMAMLRDGSLANQRLGLGAIAKLDDFELLYNQAGKAKKQAAEALAETVAARLRAKIATLTDFRTEAAAAYEEGKEIPHGGLRAKLVRQARSGHQGAGAELLPRLEEHPATQGSGARLCRGGTASRRGQDVRRRLPQAGLLHAPGARAAQD